jgi:3-deoxy-D-arabino-heptulosonate 7-phosphate (DAHP) synthase
MPGTRKGGGTLGEKRRKVIYPPINIVTIAICAVIVEVHPDPESALSDGYQSLNFEQFTEMMILCLRVAEAVGRQIAPNQQMGCCR